MDNISKEGIAILSVLLGWMLGQGAELIKVFFRRRSLFNAFRAELIDLKSHLDESKGFCKKGMSDLKDGKPARLWPQNAVTPIYDSYYKDIYTYLSRTDRRMVSHIFGHIKGFNKSLDHSHEAKNSMLCYFQIWNDISWAAGTIECYLEGKFSSLNDDLKRYRNIESELRSAAENYLH